MLRRPRGAGHIFSDLKKAWVCGQRLNISRAPTRTISSSDKGAEILDEQAASTHEIFRLMFVNGSFNYHNTIFLLPLYVGLASL